MTNELEKKFFKCFGIEPHWQYKVHQFCHFYYCDKKTIIENAYLFKERKTCKVKEVKRAYPEITDRKLLKMICILNDYEGINVQGTTIEELKGELLNQCIEYFKYPIAFEENADLCDLHNQIQQLFKEGE